MRPKLRWLCGIALVALATPVAFADPPEPAAQPGAAAPAAPDGKIPCRWGSATACAPFACLPEDPDANPDLLGPDSKAYCGRCTQDVQCGGSRCNRAEGTCARFGPAPAPGPVWPHFSLVVADLSVNLADSTDPRPIIGVGYLFQGALGRARPVLRDQGGFLYPDLPWLYGTLGASAAFAGPAQNLFVDAGLTLYRPGLPLALTTISAGALYQRQGSAIWRLSREKNTDRLGPALTLGFLQDLYVRGAYVFRLDGLNDHGAWILSLVYMRDLADDLVPARFKKYLPASMQ